MGNHIAASAARRIDVPVADPVSSFASSATADRGFFETCGSDLFGKGPEEVPSVIAAMIAMPSVAARVRLTTVAS